MEIRNNVKKCHQFGSLILVQRQCLYCFIDNNNNWLSRTQVNYWLRVFPCCCNKVFCICYLGLKLQLSHLRFANTHPNREEGWVPPPRKPLIFSRVIAIARFHRYARTLIGRLIDKNKRRTRKGKWYCKNDDQLLPSA